MLYDDHSSFGQLAIRTFRYCASAAQFSLRTPIAYKPGDVSRHSTRPDAVEVTVLDNDMLWVVDIDADCVVEAVSDTDVDTEAVADVDSEEE